jgi:short-subunit dehydrogenase
LATAASSGIGEGLARALAARGRNLALAEELRDSGVTVVTLCPGGTRTNFFEAGQYGMREFAGALQAPEDVVAAALKALARGGGLVVPRLLDKLSVFAQRFAPRGLVTKVAARIFQV